MFDESIAEKLKACAAQWDKAERLIKKAERLRAEVVMASINELRYAGRRLVDALNEHFEKKPHFEYYIQEAVMNCMRAQHDAIDSIVLFAHTRIEQMVDAFGAENVAHYFPQYTAMRQEMLEIDIIITGSRENRDSRFDKYNEIESKYLDEILKLYDSMVTSEDLLRSKKNKDALLYRLAIGGFVIGVVGIVIGVLPLLK